MRVLYFHPRATHGGASKSLIELFNVMRKSGVEGTILTPQGSAARAFSDNGMTVFTVKGLSQFDNTRYSHYKRMRWLILLREILFLPGSLCGLWRIRAIRFDILHINEITLLPLAVITKKFLKLPLVVHVRSVQCSAQNSLRTRIINQLLALYADAVIPIDYTVASTLGNEVRCKVIHNGLSVNIENLSKKKHSKGANCPIRVGFVGVLGAHKGIYELIEAVRILKSRGLIVECDIAGDDIRDLRGVYAWVLSKLGFARQVYRDLEHLIHNYSLGNQVRLLRFVDDIHSLYKTLDVLCFTTHLDAAGRPVFEAAFYSVPSVVAIKSPRPDAVIHEHTGLAIPRPDPDLIADALQRLAQDESFRITLGHHAQNWAIRNFLIENSAKEMLAIYQKLLRSNV